jgi:hypothetical protein
VAAQTLCPNKSRICGVDLHNPTKICADRYGVVFQRRAVLRKPYAALA